MPAFASDPTSAPWRWAGAAVALPLCSLFGEAQFRLLRLDVRARARATCRRAPTPPNAPSSSSSSPPRSPRSRSDPTTPGMATRSATRRVRGGEGGGEGGQETRSSQLSRSRPLPRANALFSTLMCVVALASPAILPLGLLGRILLALGAFQHACKVIEARRGYAPRGVVHAGTLRGYFASPIEPLAAQWSERAGTGDGVSNGNGRRGVRVDDAAEFNDRSFPFDDATRSDARLALAFCKRAAAKLLFCVVVINALATDVTEVRPPPVPREKDFTRPTGIDPIDTYLAAWFLSIFFEGAMDLVAAFQARSLSSNAGPSATPFARRAPFYTLVPIRPRSRGERRSLRPFSPGVCFSPPIRVPRFRSRHTATPFNSASGAFELHPSTLRSRSCAAPRPRGVSSAR